MFKNRSIQMRLVNTKNPSSDEPIETMPIVDYAQIREIAEAIATKAIIGVAVYVAVDTLRQVIVKVTPQN